MLLSEELREQFEQQQLAAANPESAVPPETAPDPADVQWPRAIALAGFAGLLLLALMVLGLAFSPLLLLAMFWIVGAPIVVLGIYCARNPLTRVTTGFGASLGSLSGLSIALAYVLLNAVMVLTKRFALHQGAEIDAMYANLMATMHAQIDAQAAAQPAMQAGVAEAHAYIDRLNVPEYRASAYLFATAMFSGVYVLYTTVAGAFAGLLRSRARPR